MRYTSLSCSPERFAYLQARRRETVSIHVLRLLVLIAFLFLWEMGARWGWIPSFSPAQAGYWSPWPICMQTAPCFCT